MAKTAATWDALLRRQLKLEHGPGWSISEQSGRTKLTRRHSDGGRSSVMLEVRWGAGSASSINAVVARLRQLMEERQLGLAEAHKLTAAAAAFVGEASTGGINWAVVADQFLASRADRRATTLKDLHLRVSHALATLATKPYPRDGRTLMKAYAAQHFANCPSGGQGRRRHLSDLAALLTFAVDRCGAEAHWRPLSGPEMRELVGSSDRTANDELTPPIKPEQLAALLDALEAEGKSDLWLAVALVGLFGLRPAELAVLRIEEGRLYVGGNVKRNLHKAKTDRLVLPLDIPGREGEGARALQIYASGLVKLPQRIIDAGQQGKFKVVGDAFRKRLEYFHFWQSLVASTPGLTPYSLRHGYAWRGHKSYSRALPMRDLAALMGHNVATHQKHYGRWTDEQGLIDAVAQLLPASTLPVVGKSI